MSRDLDLDELRHRGAVHRIGPRAMRAASLRRLQRLLHHRQRRAGRAPVSRRPRLLPTRPAATPRLDRRGASLRTPPALAAAPECRVLELTVQRAKPLDLALKLSDPRAQRPVRRAQPVHGAALTPAQRRQPRPQPLDLLAQPRRPRDVGSKRLDLLLLGPLPRARPLVQRPKAARRTTLPDQLPALCLKLLLQCLAPQASRILCRGVERRRRDAASRNDSRLTSPRHSSGIPQSGISVQRRRRKPRSLQISAPRDNRTITTTHPCWLFIRLRSCSGPWIPAFAGMTGNTQVPLPSHSREGGNPWGLP